MNGNRQYSVLIAEDEPIILNDIAHEIEKADMGFLVVGKAGNGLEALTLYRSLNPDVLVTDIKMPVMDGITLVSQIRKDDNDLKIIILSGYGEFDYAQQAIRLNISDYLLKPLETKQLLDVLQSVCLDLNQKKNIRDRNILVSTAQGTHVGENLPFSYAEGRFALFLVNIGNLYHDFFAESALKIINDLWRKANLEETLALILDSAEKLWIVDEKIANQKLIIAAYTDTALFQHGEALAENMLAALQNVLAPEKVNISVADSMIDYKEIYSVSKILRINMDKWLIPGRSSIIRSRKARTESEILVDAAFKKTLLINLYAGQFDELKKQTFWLIDELSRRLLPQKMIEQNIMQLITVLLSNEPSGDTDHIHMEFVRRRLFNAHSVSDIKHDIWDLIVSRLQSTATSEASKEMLANRIAEYMHEHFLNDITIEELSRVFHFNGNYLTRIFKKCKGMSPVKYLIQIRINEAIRIMRENEGLNIKQIAEMVGYADAYYFSRIFKNRMGVSPSDYKSNI